MRSPSKRTPTSPFWAASGLLVAILSCTDSGLEPARTAGGTVYDDELRLTGEICLSPDTDAVFPVKVLFVVDTSDSMSVTDRSHKRSDAVTAVLQRYQANPAVLFGVISFNSQINATPGFANPPDLTNIDLTEADRLTDYQGALGAAYRMISQDIATSSPAEIARSKYIIIFFSDGTPDPQCSASPTPCGTGDCLAHQHCRATVCKDDYLICTVPRKDWATAFTVPTLASLYPDLEAGADYNLTPQILRAVDDIMGLQDFYHVGEIRLHTAFLYDPEAASDPLAAPFGLDREGGVALMTAMAEHGLGTFTEFDSASKIDFLSINYTPYIEENALAGVLATNLSVIDTGDGLEADSDGDGLTDAQEQAGHTCVTAGPGCSDPADSDGDGYTDLFEERNRVSGFDPLDPNKPLTPCSSKRDRDGDLLRDCEEDFLKTNSRLPDSDGDRIPDGLEFRAGMDPLDRTDAFGDMDSDGDRNLDEITAHTNPNVAPPPSALHQGHGRALLPSRRTAHQAAHHRQGHLFAPGGESRVALLRRGAGWPRARLWPHSGGLRGRTLRGRRGQVSLRWRDSAAGDMPSASAPAYSPFALYGFEAGRGFPAGHRLQRSYLLAGPRCRRWRRPERRRPVDAR
jgi:hypothetical protein